MDFLIEHSSFKIILLMISTCHLITNAQVLRIQPVLLPEVSIPSSLQDVGTNKDAMPVILGEKQEKDIIRIQSINMPKPNNRTRKRLRMKKRLMDTESKIIKVLNVKRPTQPPPSTSPIPPVSISTENFPMMMMMDTDTQQQTAIPMKAPRGYFYGRPDGPAFKDGMPQGRALEPEPPQQPAFVQVFGGNGKFDIKTLKVYRPKKRRRKKKKKLSVDAAGSRR